MAKYRNTTSGLRNLTLLDDISKSGSLVVSKTSPNSYQFDDSNELDGVIFGKLSNPKYNESDLVKSIDTRIFELIPIEPPPLDDDVPRPVYNEVTQSVIDLTEEVIRLNTIVVDLTAKVSELEIVSESLRVDVDAQRILVASFENQLNQANIKISNVVVDLQNSIQKGTAEAIQRVSLTARNQSLKEQNDQYKEILEGKQAKIAEGAKVGMDFSVKVIQKGEAAQNDLTFRGRAKDDGRGSWINGPDVEFYNFSREPITLTFEQSGDTAGSFEKLASFTLEPKQTRFITIKTIQSKIDSFRPSAGFNLSGDKGYKGTFIVKSSKSQVSLAVSIQKQSGDKWTGGN
jgi:hypothetical protein